MFNVKVHYKNLCFLDGWNFIPMLGSSFYYGDACNNGVYVYHISSIEIVEMSEDGLEVWLEDLPNERTCRILGNYKE